MNFIYELYFATEHQTEHITTTTTTTTTTIIIIIIIYI